VPTRSGPGKRSAASDPPGNQRRAGLVLLRGLLALVIAFLVLEAALNPWTLHIGGRFTPLTAWDGYGTVRASDGGRYVLFTRLQGGTLDSACGFFARCQTLRGSAMICTGRGSTYTLQLLGSVDAWWSTDGAKTSFELRDVNSGPVPDGRVISFKGSWHGTRLVLADTGNSFTGVFTLHGAIRHRTPASDAGHASVTLRYGSSAAFANACRTLPA
jgi:hypothetical protein